MKNHSKSRIDSGIVTCKMSFRASPIVCLELRAVKDAFFLFHRFLGFARINNSLKIHILPTPPKTYSKSRFGVHLGTPKMLCSILALEISFGALSIFDVLRNRTKSRFYLKQQIFQTRLLSIKIQSKIRVILFTGIIFFDFGQL